MRSRLTEKIRSEPRVIHLPIIRLRSVAADEDIGKGKAARIDDYQIKLDLNKLLDALHGLLPAQRGGGKGSDKTGPLFDEASSRRCLPN